jgi:rhodanese-related sulfurtransferase
MGLLSFLRPPSLSAIEARETLRRREALVLDVRERHEWKRGRIAGSKNVPLGSPHARATELDRERRYVAVCRTGARSSRATAQLRKAGYDVVNLKGGMLAWRREGLPLEPRDARIV